MGFSRLFLGLLRRSVSPLSLSSSLQPQCCRSPPFHYYTIPTFESSIGTTHHRHRALLSSSAKEADIEAATDPRPAFVAKQIEQLEIPGNIKEQSGAGLGLEKLEKRAEIHPWPEWTAFIECLVANDYFKGFADDDDDDDEEEELVNTSHMLKDYNHVRNACLNFGRDRFDILRSLSKDDIMAIVEYGCPSLDRKVVNSGKRLRSYVNIEEGDVCSKCNLRGSCDRAYINVPKEEGARTVDVVRILLTYGLDPMTSSAENKLHMKKTVKASIRKLLKEVVELSTTPLDPNLPQPRPKQPPPMIKQSPPPPITRIGRTDIEMKKGDWLCPGCNVINFARNMICIQCNEKRPKKNLSSGEWECPDCNFLNFSRNMKCLKCDCKRPKDDRTEIAKQLNPGDWKCPKCDFLNFRRNMTCLECDCKHPGDDNTKIARQLNSGDWKCPQCNFMNFGRNMTCLKCDCKCLKDEHSEIRGWRGKDQAVEMTKSKAWNVALGDDDEYNYHAKTNEGMANSPRRRKGGGCNDDDYNFEDFPVRGGKSEITGGKKSGQDGNKTLSQFSSGMDRSSSFGVNSNDLSDIDLILDDDDDDDGIDGDIDHKKNRADGGGSFGRASSTSARKGSGTNNDLNFNDFPVRGGNSGITGRRKSEQNGSQFFSQRSSGVNKSSSSGVNANVFSDLDLDDDDDSDDIGYKWKGADSGRSSGKASDRYGGLSASSIGKGKAYKSDDTDDEDGWFGSSRAKELGPSKRSLSSKKNSVKKSFENFGDFDEDDDDDLYESVDEQPQVSRKKTKELRSFGSGIDKTESRKGRQPSFTSRARGSVDNDDGLDDLDDIDDNEEKKCRKSNAGKVVENRARNGSNVSRLL